MCDPIDASHAGGIHLNWLASFVKSKIVQSGPESVDAPADPRRIRPDWQSICVRGVSVGVG